jgi:hypothetical protein
VALWDSRPAPWISMITERLAYCTNGVMKKTTRELKRLGAIPFIRPEIDFLYFEEARYFEHAFRCRMRIIARAILGMALAEARLRTMARFDEWPSYQMGKGHQTRITRMFNKKFSGKPNVDGVEFDRPRPGRTTNSLNQERHRHRIICRDFQVSYQPARGSRVLPDGRTDVEDSDYSKETGRGGGAKTSVQPPPDSDDTDPAEDPSEPESRSSESSSLGGGTDGGDTDDDTDGEDGGDGAGGDSDPPRRFNDSSKGKVKQRATSEEAADDGTLDSTMIMDGVDDTLTDEDEPVDESEDDYMAEDEGGGDFDEGDDEIEDDERRFYL